MNTFIKDLIQQYLKYNLSEVIDYDKFNNYALVHHSSTIEGSTLSEIETRFYWMKILPQRVNRWNIV